MSWKKVNLQLSIIPFPSINLTYQRCQKESCAQEIHGHGELLDIAAINEPNDTTQSYDDPGDILSLSLALKVLQWKEVTSVLRFCYISPTICVGMSNILSF